MNYNNNKKGESNRASESSRNYNEHESKSSVEDEDIKTIGNRPAISSTFSPISINIEIPQTHRFSEMKPDHNLQSHGKHDLSYYQPQPDNCNQHQHYFHDRRT